MSAIDALFSTRLLEDGDHWAMTLPTYVSRFLVDIEGLFGPRDHSFTLVGIEIDSMPGATPRLWFPNSGIVPDDPEKRSRHVVIRLTRNALSGQEIATWQLAHECVHLLAPWNPSVDGRPTNYLEEGLATWFQNSRVPEAEWHEEPYATAEALVSPAMDVLPQAVKRIRQEQGLRIGEITPHALQEYCPNIGEEISRKLCQPFERSVQHAMDAAGAGGREEAQ